MAQEQENYAAQLSQVAALSKLNAAQENALHRLKTEIEAQKRTIAQNGESRESSSTAERQAAARAAELQSQVELKNLEIEHLKRDMQQSLEIVSHMETEGATRAELIERERSKSAPSWYNRGEYDDLITSASERFGVSFPLLKAIIKAESDFDAEAVSKKGAMGLMQIMPQNFKFLGIKDPFDPTQNINAGARYFRQLYDRFNGKLALSLAAYNAGPTAVDRYQTIPPYEETEEYVRRVLKFYYNYKN